MSPALAPASARRAATSPWSAAASAARSRQEAGGLARDVVHGVERAVHGRREAVATVVCAVLARGHVLVQDVPGSGKTTLARALAATLGGRFGRVQGTADLLPGDVTGSGVWRPGSADVVFVPGPVFCDVLLADELNRVPPRTQSAFFEVMDERAVTVDGVRHPLADDFVLVATQNPLDSAGTYPLPDGQLDRFAVTVRLGRPGPDVERAVLRSQLAGRRAPSDLEPVLAAGDLAALQQEVAATHVSDAVLDHAARLAEGTRAADGVALGASTRATLVLLRCAQARALVAGRDHVLPDDLQALAVPVLAHRLVLHDDDPWGAPGARTTAQDVVDRVVAGTAAPPLA